MSITDRNQLDFSFSTENLRAASPASPFVKWVGGKQALASQIIEYFPRKVNTYYEPFLGGGSLFFKYYPDRAVISDMNPWLIDAYIAIRDSFNEVTCVLDGLKNTKSEYLAVRSIDPWSVDLVDRAAYLIYLNKTCFRGLFRVNKKGRFNVPYGNYDRKYYSYENLQRVSLALREADIRHCDFEQCLSSVRKGDFVYLDPPYFKYGGYSDFNRYTSQKFNEDDHRRLAKVCSDLDKVDVKWAQSNSDTEFIRNLYSEYSIKTIKARREINLNSNNRDINEILIKNY